MRFTGQTERSIDEKSRISLPVEMRDGFPQGIVYAAPDADGSICLYPESTFEEFTDAIDQSLLQSENTSQFLDIFFSLSKRLEIDKQGRIRLPDNLLSFAGLEAQACVHGAGKYVKVRNNSSWERQEIDLAKLQSLKDELRSSQVRGEK